MPFVEAVRDTFLIRSGLPDQIALDPDASDFP